jgi:hypothetical protein
MNIYRLPQTETDKAREIEYLKNYRGNLELFYSLGSQLNKNGSLSPKQWDCVTRQIEQPKFSEEKKGETWLLSKFFASVIGKELGLHRPHYAIEIVGVARETDKAYLVKAKLSAMRSSYCSVCGRPLSDSSSIQNGIGPICAKEYGVKTTEELDAFFKVNNDNEIEKWIPKSQIKKVVV